MPKRLLPYLARRFPARRTARAQAAWLAWLAWRDLRRALLASPDAQAAARATAYADTASLARRGELIARTHAQIEALLEESGGR